MKGTTLEGVKVDIGLDDKARRAVGTLLNGVLADEFALYARARGFHWNVTGPDFGPLHELFEKEYRALSEVVDETAERARALGVKALGSLDSLRRAARIDATGDGSLEAREMIESLLHGHETMVKTLRRDVDECDRLHDQGTLDFLTGLMKAHEKSAWMLRAHLE